MRNEIVRRQSNTEKVLHLFKASPLVWIDARTLMQVGGTYAWRTRVSEVRQIVEAAGGQLQNRQRRRVVERDGTRRVTGAVISEYRYVPPTSFGASSDAKQPTLFGLLPDHSPETSRP